MPGPEVCDAITDPETKDRCLNYEDEFAEQKVNEGMNRIDYAGNMNFNEDSILNPMSKVKKTPTY